MESRTSTPVGQRDEEYAYEAVVAELVDRLEVQATELTRLQVEAESLRRDREQLETELTMARGWVRELALALEEAEARLDESPAEAAP